MQPIQITSLDDARLSPYRNLKRSNWTRWSGHFIAEGNKLVERLLASDYEVESILLSEREFERFPTPLGKSTALYVVPDELVEQIVGFNFHRGALACGQRRPPQTIADFFGQRPADRSPVRIVLASEVQNPENLGSLLRIATAFSIDAVVLGPGCADPFSRRVLRVSMGAALRIPLLESHDLPADIERLRREFGVTVYATCLDPAARPLVEIVPSERWAVLFGSEGHGLADELIAAADRKIVIPMAEGVDSLNVAVAAGIVLHHFSQGDALRERERS